MINENVALAKPQCIVISQAIAKICGRYLARLYSRGYWSKETETLAIRAKVFPTGYRGGTAIAGVSRSKDHKHSTQRRAGEFVVGLWLGHFSVVASVRY